MTTLSWQILLLGGLAAVFLILSIFQAALNSLSRLVVMEAALPVEDAGQQPGVPRAR